MKIGYCLVSILLTLSACSRNPSDTPRRAFESNGKHRQLLRVVVNGKSGFIDGSGKIVIAPQFQSVNDFSDGRAVVCVGDCNFMKRIMRTSNPDTPEPAPQYSYGYIDETGKMVINPIYSTALDFSEGLAAVCTGLGCQVGVSGEQKWGFVDKSGAEVIKPQFLSVQTFSEGLAAACMSVCIGADAQWGFIDRTGKFVVNPQYNFVMPFKEGSAYVQIGQGEGAKYGYIDKSGTYIWTPSN